MLIGDRIYFKVADNAMIENRIYLGDVVLVDRNAKVYPNDIAVIVCESELVLRQVKSVDEKCFTIIRNALCPEVFDINAIIGKVITNRVSL